MSTAFLTKQTADIAHFCYLPSSRLPKPPECTKSQPVTFDFLHDEAFSPKEAGAELTLEFNADEHAFGRT